jgi:tetratricopeptide (TPR) repeat protein
MTTLFISHSSQDDGFVRELAAALADQGQEVWIDSRQLRGGDPLWLEIQRGIEAAAAFAVVVSPDALQSKWVGQELRHALKVQKKRGKDKYPVIPLSLDGTKLGVLEEFFGEEPVYVPVSSDAGGVEAGLDAILVALRLRDPADVPAPRQPAAEPLEELVLELSDLKFHEQDGVRRPAARARLVYEPATPGQREVASSQSWRFIAPLGPIEAEELRWYLEQYAVWPAGVPVIRDRAARVERDLVTWGRRLHQAGLPAAYTANVLQAWARVGAHAGRRFSVHVDASLEAGATADEVVAAREAATLLLGLPWELLHDGTSYLFQGAKPVRVRRRLPNTAVLDVPVLAPPIRILLVTARPEDDACGYLDHRASALPLVEAMEALPGLVKLHLLSPPTFEALGQELQRAYDAREPYHVLHFDGHGVYDRIAGLGGLCFEDPQDAGKLEQRRHVTVFTADLGPLLRDYRIPLVFLEACQTAQAEQAAESVASELLKVGVASVVAMSHSVLVTTASLFVAAFYRALAEGQRVGDAMLAGQRRLKEDTRRGRIFGADELRLEDWFVPVLFQERADPQLFRAIPSPQTVADFRAGLAARLAALPPPPETGFVGRSRELLALQRLLLSPSPPSAEGGEGPGVRGACYAVIRGQGGEGKTALAAEFGRWLVRSQQVRRAAFVSAETHGHVAAVVDALGKQLVRPEFSAAGDLEAALRELERALREQAALLVVDNMESVLLPPFMAQATPAALSEEGGRELAALLALYGRLNAVGETRLLFTSREALPAPFDAAANRRELGQLAREDAVKLVERALNASDQGDCFVAHDAPRNDRPKEGRERADAAADARREEIEQLVDAVHCHARTLALLAPALRERGPAQTRVALVALMAEMDRRFPGSRERSLFASVELSLRRMTPANRQRAAVLGAFHGGVDLDVLHWMMAWQEADVASLAAELIATGLATPDRYNHLTLDPALCPYLAGRLDEAERGELAARWVAAMAAYTDFLVQQWGQNIEMAMTLTTLELPNLFALLDRVQSAGHAGVMIALTSSLFTLLQNIGRPRLLTVIGRTRDAAAAALENTWNSVSFEVARTRIEQQLLAGRLREAFDDAQELFRRARVVGEQAYQGADYDLAMAHFTLAHVLKTVGGAEQALPLLDEARLRFEAIARERATMNADRMVSVCLAEEGGCLCNLGRLDDAAAAYEESIQCAKQLGIDRQVAVSKANLGRVRMGQRRYGEALAAYTEAYERFAVLNEPASVATVRHQIGMILQEMSRSEAAEDAYRESLAISVQLGDAAGQASTLVQLGNLYNAVLGRPEEATAFYRQAADKYVESRDAAKEGVVRSNLAMTLRKLGRLNEARQEIRRAIECDAQFGHASSPWASWGILADIETDAGDRPAAAAAREQATACFLAYRRAGGENHSPAGRLALAVSQALRAGDPAAAATLLRQLAAHPDAAWLLPFIRALQAISAGSRDRGLAAAPDMHYELAAEILFLIETLEG